METQAKSAPTSVKMHKALVSTQKERHSTFSNVVDTIVSICAAKTNMGS